MPFTIKDKNEANEGRKDQKRSNRDDGVDGDVEFHLDMVIVISTFGSWRAQLEAPVAVPSDVAKRNMFGHSKKHNRSTKVLL